MSKKNDPRLATANVLGYQSRKLREAVEEESAAHSNALAAVDRFTARAGQTRSGVKDEEEKIRQEKVDRARTVTAPIMAAVRARVAEAAALKKEHGDLIARLDQMDWKWFRKSVPNVVRPGDPVSTTDRIAFLERAVNEASLALAAKDDEIAEAAARLEFCADIESSAAKYDLAFVKQLLDGNRPAFIRSRMKSINRWIAEIDEDIAASEADAETNDAPMAQTEVK